MNHQFPDCNPETPLKQIFPWEFKGQVIARTVSYPLLMTIDNPSFMAVETDSIVSTDQYLLEEKYNVARRHRK